MVALVAAALATPLRGAAEDLAATAAPATSAASAAERATREGWRRPPERAPRSTAARADTATVLVRFHPGVTREERANALTRHGAALRAPVGGTGYALVATAPGRAAALIRELRRDPRVAAVERNHVRQALGEPNDLVYAKGDQRHYLRTVRMPAAWDAAAGLAPVTIAVIDTGVDADTPDLAGRVLPGRDFANGDADAADDEGHGTMVAGFAAAAGNNGKGVAGVAWNAQILPVKVLDLLGNGFDADIAAGITWAADNGADVINLSLGGPGESDVLREAIQYALARDVVVVAAAGNDGSPEPLYPAAYPGVVTVGATDWAGNVTWWSSYGPWVDVVAPGYKVWSTVLTPGPGERYDYGYGTSFASPLVAGVAALVRSRNSSWTQAQVAAELSRSARDAGPRGFDDFYGHGIVDAAAALGAAARAAPHRAPAGDALEPNGSADRATPLTAATLNGGTISPQGEVDWFAKDVAAPGTLRFEIAASEAGSYAEAMYPAAQVYGPRLQPIGSPVRGVSTTTTVNVPAAEAGRYYVKVWNDAASRSRVVAGSASAYSVTTTIGSSSSTAARFEPNDYLPITAWVNSSAVADVTGDGREDVLVTSTQSDWPAEAYKLFVYRQRRDGYLAPPEKHALSTTESSGDLPISTGDADGDGIDDVAVVSTRSSAVPGVDVFYGGATLSARTLAYQATDMRDARLADIDRDGKADLVVSSVSRGLQILRSTGSGFAAPRTVSAQTGVVEVGDVSGDGRPDLVLGYVYVAATSVWYLDVFLQQADGTFAARRHTLGGPPTWPGELAIGDVSGDGRADVVVAEPNERGSSKIAVLRQDASGGLLAPVRYSSFDLPHTLAVGDMNADGRPDLAVGHADGRAGVYLQTASGTFGTEELYETGERSYHSEDTLAVGDVNADGLLDVVLADFGGFFVLRQPSSRWPPPTWVRDTFPTDGAEGASTGAEPTVRFARPLDPASVSSTTVRLENAETGAAIAAGVAYDAAAALVRVRPGAPLAAGTPYRIVVSGVVDTAGAAMDGAFSVRFTAGATGDATAPDTTITSALWHDAEAGTGFEFTASEPGATFECSLAAGAWAPCDSPYFVKPLPGGSGSVRVRATDAAGNVDGTPAARAWTAPPANDAFANAQPLAGAVGTTSATTAGATKEAGEPNHASAAGGQSVWFRWTAPAGGSTTFDTFGSEFETVLAVYTGSGVPSLREVAANDNAAGMYQSRITFNATAGTTYAVAIDGEARTTVTRGTATLSWSGPAVADTTPPDTTILAGPSGTMGAADASFTFSTTEAGTFQCSLDGAAFAACTSPKAYSSLTAGAHAFEVRAIDSAGNADPSPTRREWTVVGAPILLAAGDIARCGQTGDDATALLLDRHPDATVAALGDTVYQSGTTEEYNTCYDPSWGRHKGRTRPAVGNHEYETPGAAGYFAYFGAAAGDPAKGYYSYDVGGWHIVVLNSNCTFVACAAGSEQERWLRADLAASSAQCTIGYWHHPRYSSGPHGDDATVDALWDALYQHGADLVLVGHDHHYERFAPMNDREEVDAAFGMRHFIVGTGGAGNRPTVTVRPNSEVRDYSALGVLRLALRPGGYDWKFLPEDGQTFTDTGSGTCHGSPDRTPPETTLTAGPTGVVASTSATFAFTSEPGASFECSLDGAAYAACTSPKAYTSLADGTHTFRVRAKDPVGNTDPSPAERTWTVDTVPPETTIVTGPPAATAATGATFVFSSEPGATFECSLDNTAYTACSSPAVYSALAEGVHTFRVRAKDGVGYVDTTPAERSWTVDTAPPDTAVSSGPPALTNSRDANLAFASEAGVSFECSLDGAAFSACTSPKTYTGLGDGVHTFRVRAKDGAGNLDASPAERSWTIDTAPPETTISGGPSVPTASNAATFSFAGEPDATFECSLDGAAYASCSSPKTYTALADGTHTLRVRAKDAAGNVDPTPAERAWTVDTVPPDTTITSGPASLTGSADASFAFAGVDSAALECALDGAPFADCASPRSYTALADGTHTFRVRARDAAGNVDPTPAGRVWTIDSALPETAIDVGPPALTNSRSAEFAFSATKIGSVFECALDGGAAAPCVGSLTRFDGLSDGEHALEVVAISPTGKRDPSPAVHRWHIDATPPETAIHAEPPALTNASTVPFAFSSSETAAFECSLNGGAFETCVSPRTFSIDADGAHTFRVRARDAAGNVDASPAERSWIVDRLAPDTAIVIGPPAATTATDASFAFSSNEPGSFECSLDGGPYGACASPITFNGVATGAHVFRVRATDSAGNTDAAPAEHAWTVTVTVTPTPAPQPPVESPPPHSPQPAPACRVPRLAGKTIAQARTLLTRAGCRAGQVTAAYSRHVRKGRIVSQRPRAGTRLRRGARVAFVVSRGPRPR